MFMQSLLANKTQESKLWYEMQNDFYASIQSVHEAELYGNPHVVSSCGLLSNHMVSFIKKNMFINLRNYWFKKTWEKITNLSHYKEVTQATWRFKSLGIWPFVQ